jgi:hypothetical protein
MKVRRTLRVVAAALSAGCFALLSFSCEGGPSGPEVGDGGCSTHVVLVDELQSEDPSATTCAADSDCAIAHEGDTCGCPYLMPRAVTKAIAARVAERKAAAQCTCPKEQACDASGPLSAKAGCVGGRCATIDAGCRLSFDRCLPEPDGGGADAGE